MVHVVDALVLYAGAADVRAVVAVPGDDVHFRAVRFDHGDLLRARPFGDVDFAGDPRAGAVGGNRIPGVPARILYAALNPDRLRVRDEGRGPAVLEGQGRHRVVHLEEDIVVKAHDRRHAFPERDGAPRVAFDSHEVAVAELAPFGAVDPGGVPRRGREVEFEKPAAFADGSVGRRGRALAARSANVVEHRFIPPARRSLRFRRGSRNAGRWSTR